MHASLFEEQARWEFDCRLLEHSPYNVSTEFGSSLGWFQATLTAIGPIRRRRRFEVRRPSACNTRHSFLRSLLAPDRFTRGWISTHDTKTTIPGRNSPPSLLKTFVDPMYDLTTGYWHVSIDWYVQREKGELMALNSAGSADDHLYFLSKQAKFNFKSRGGCLESQRGRGQISNVERVTETREGRRSRRGENEPQRADRTGSERNKRNSGGRGGGQSHILLAPGDALDKIATGFA
ncbi:uncharacterized protein LOC143146947 [Ptiloglossa arizonensis]|uniref:uncharacterized protein LOC143146947 n=1 Tax=Ptiloglossa arizonensis TaxID=3350558 RepID=UPI003F9FE814